MGVFYKNEIIVQYVHDGIALFVQRKQMCDALNHRRGRAQAILRVFLKCAKINVGAQLIGQIQINGEANYFELFHVVDKNAH